MFASKQTIYVKSKKKRAKRINGQGYISERKVEFKEVQTGDNTTQLQKVVLLYEVSLSVKNLDTRDYKQVSKYAKTLTAAKRILLEMLTKEHLGRVPINLF